MKLITCIKCTDVVRLEKKLRKCSCGLSSGQYVDDLNAEISGPCFALGFANKSLVDALYNQPERGQGERFEAFVIEKHCPTVKRLDPAPVLPRRKTEEERITELMELVMGPTNTSGKMGKSSRNWKKK